MGITNPKNTQLKAAGLAVGAGILAAVATMFVPVSLIETITGSTGISEIIPATAAPLGDTARAVMAFLVGAVALVIVLIVSLRPETASVHKQALNKQALKEPVEEEDENVDRFANLKARAAGLSIPKISLPKMPWVKNEDDILDLADLPKLRTFDAHPDAPARRPLSASSDLTEPLKDITPSLPEIALPEIALAEDVETIPVTPAPIIAAPVAQPVEVTQTVAMEPIAAQAAADVSAEPTLSEMVAQLEAAVAQRKVQLAELEIVAANLTAGNPTHLEPVEAQDITTEEPLSSQPEITETQPPEQPHFDRPALEAVPASPRTPVDDDMDAALSAALETLQRMNVQAR